MDPLWQEINEAIHLKKKKSVAPLIKRYLKRNRHSPESIYEASEFYRKNGDYANALRVLPKERKSSAISDIDTKLELQLARILNILGASHYSLRVVERIRAAKRAKSKVQIAEIYHCNGKFQELLDLLGSDYPLPETEPWHQDWVPHFYYAYALNAVGRHEEAIQRAEQIYSRTGSRLIQAIALCHKGQFLACGGSPKSALPFLQQSLGFFAEDDLSFDHGSTLKWIGISFLKLEKLKEAQAALRKAFKIFYQPSFRPEDWMEILLWLEKIPGIGSAREFAQRFLALGGLAYQPLLEAGVEIRGTDDPVFSITKIEKTRKTKHIDRANDTAWNGKRARLGLDLVDELVAYLIYSGEYGLPQFKVYELLWPNEVFSFAQHQLRLAQLVTRARSRGYRIRWKGFHLQLLNKDITVTGSPEKPIRGGSFLSEFSEFSREDVQRYFGISRSSAITLCREWMRDGLVSLEKKSRYRSISRHKATLPSGQKI